MSLLNAETLPVIFSVLMAISMLLYVILDGYDLGVGMLLPFAHDINEKNIMVASIGPFWDANETWLVLGVGLLLVAFPKAHGIVLTALYLPVAFMLIGLILRGVAFDFRMKARTNHQAGWNVIFSLASLLTTFAQGIMIGRYITGFAEGYLAWTFAVLAGLGLSATYTLLGASWLLMKTEGALQVRALSWIRYSILATAIAILMISVVTPFASQSIAEKWFTLPNFLWLSPLPLGCIALFYLLYKLLPNISISQKNQSDKHCWVPFVCSIGIVVLSYIGLAYSIFPYIVLGQLTIWQAASDQEALRIILWGALVVLPTIFAYSIFSYYVFWGKSNDLTYD